MSQELVKKLSAFLHEGKDWERKPTNVPGVFLLKLPPYKSRPAVIAMEVNPLDISGSPTKKRGTIIRSNSELKEIIKILNNAKLEELANSVEKICSNVMQYKNKRETIEI